MIKNITLLLLALLSMPYCFAQETIRFTLPEDSVLKSNVCRELRVRDMRKNKDDIGGLSIHTFNEQETRIITDQPLPEFLSNYFNKISTDKQGELTCYWCCIISRSARSTMIWGWDIFVSVAISI